MSHHQEDYAKNTLYLGHFFGGVSTVGTMTYWGFRLALGELSAQASSFIGFSLWSCVSASLMSYAYYFGYQSGKQVQNPEMQRMIIELEKKNRLIEEYKSQQDKIEALYYQEAHPNSPTSTNLDIESYEILSSDEKHFKAN